jgi:isoquinoline 1-oxidoreductase beta subunit
MPGVMSVRRVPGGVAVVADSFWRARQAVTALEITWSQGTMASDFSSDFQLARMKRGFARPGAAAEEIGAQPPLQAAARVIEAEYDAPYLAHATMEPQNATARFNPDGTLDVWVGNQGPDFFAAGAAEAGGVALDKVTIHTPYLGGGFGRRLYYGMEATTQAVLLAKAEGAPVKVVWHREEDFARDHFRPLSTAKLRAGLDAKGVLTGLDITAVGEGPMGRHNAAALANPAVDESVVEGLTAKPYAIANRRVGYVKVRQPPSIGFWRSVGHSANAFFYECFLDEIAAAGGKDPLEFRLSLLRDARRQEAVLKAVVELAGGWKTQSYEVDGASRALGVAMSSAYGTEVAVIAEISASAGEVTVHHVWIAVDPGSVVNPALVVAQMQSGVAMGCSIALLEQVTFHDGWIEQSNFDTYPFLSPDRMPQVHVRILESGAPMGGIGETGVPAVVPAIVNAVATLTGQRVRTLPLSKTKIGQA